MCARGRVLAEPRLSPDGSTLAVAVTAGGRGHLALVACAGGPELTLTADPPVAPAASYGGGVFDWLPSGEGLVYVAAGGGLYLQPVVGGPPRCLVADGSIAGPAVSPDADKVAYVVDGRHVAVAPLAEGGPWPVRLSAGADFAFDPVWSPDGTQVAWVEWDVPAMPWDDSRIVVAPADGSAPPVAVGLPGPVAASQPRFSPDGSAMGLLCDGDGWVNLWRAGADGSDPVPLLSEPAEHGGPSWGPGERSWVWSPDGRQIAFCRNEEGFGRLCVLDVASGSVRDLDRGVYGGLSWSGDLIAGIRSGARTPTQVVVLEPEPGAKRRRTLVRGPVAGFEAADLVEPEVVAWDSEQVAGVGTTVHGRLYRSATGRADNKRGAGAPPLLVWAHGGPTGQNQVTWIPRVAFFVERGWNVLQVDHRGSTGWGRAYAQALREQWGHLDVVDTAAGMRAAAAHGWGHPQRMVPIGGSAGGLTVLLLLALHPELCAAGVSLYGVADLFELEETTHRFEAHYLQSMIGPLPAAAERYWQRSPINHAEQIVAPLLVLQGSADRVVPKAQADSLVGRMQQAGRSVEYHVYDGEGHGWSRPEVVTDELERTWAFLQRHVLRRRR
jgi:dipeptidyl aminopeptidase/acylaminoacyl peptidase